MRAEHQSAAYWGLRAQRGHVPGPGIEPAAFLVHGMTPNRATPASARILLLVILPKASTTEKPGLGRLFLYGLREKTSA